MFVETSAIVAIFRDEADARELVGRLSAASRRETSVVNAVEAALAIGKRTSDYFGARREVVDLLARLEISMEAIPAGVFDEVLQAYQRYGKGTGHPAQLNFGDCFSYVMAKRSGLTLLYKGTDFVQTDIG